MTSIYSTGTVSVTNGNAVVPGSGTAWAVALVTGGSFSCSGLSIPILSVESDTSLTLAYPWPGATAAGAAYAIQRDNSDAANVVDLYDKLTRVLLQLSLVGIHPNNSGSLAKRDALALGLDDDNYLFLRAELGVEFAFYRWDGPSLAWIGPFTVADAVAGGVSSIVQGSGVTVDNTNPAIPVIKLANMANATIKGRATAGTGAPEDLTMAQLKTLLLASTVIREVLTANRTYYVRTDGNNNNSGLVNNSGGAFLTIQKAIDTVAMLDLSVYNVTIQCGTGTGGTAGLTLKSFGGAGTVTLQGDTATPSNVTISTINATCIAANGVSGKWVVAGFKLVAATSGYGISATGGSRIDVGVVEFGACATAHVDAEQFAVVTFLSNYTISGGSTRHWFVTTGALIQCVSLTITLTGTPAFSSAFLIASRDGGALISGNTFTGSATGSRYSVTYTAWADVAGAGATYLPGNAAGSTSSGGTYA
ncbi:MAG: hypothetical protein E5X76_20165 [Mesorhizobium sp.]|nr:MAG: hypothetical protein E5X76_20165 [Mesorhizobium sp.]